MDRVILHCDMNGFFASVECLYYPHLKDVPMAVCGNEDNRHGIILAKNEHAKKFGIVTAETAWSAKKKCPNIQFVKPHHDRYKKYSKLINEIYRKYTDLVEPFSIDESWLDVTGSQKLFGNGKAIADKIRMDVKESYDLTLSAGVSYNKIFAKMGSEYKKPDATTEITRENYKSLLWPLPVRELFSVGKSSAQKLSLLHIKTIGDLANYDSKKLESILGKQGLMIHDFANGLDNSPVRHYLDSERAKSIGSGLTFKRDLSSSHDLRKAVVALSDSVATKLRKDGLKCNGVQVSIKDPLFQVIQRQRQLPGSTHLSEEISQAAFEIVEASWGVDRPIRMLTITAIQLSDEYADEQMSLFSIGSERREKTENIERAMDSIRDKFGSSSITFGGLINNDLGIDVKEEEQDE